MSPCHTEEIDVKCSCPRESKEQYNGKGRSDTAIIKGQEIYSDISALLKTLIPYEYKYLQKKIFLHLLTLILGLSQFSFYSIFFPLNTTTQPLKMNLNSKRFSNTFHDDCANISIIESLLLLFYVCTLNNKRQRQRERKSKTKDITIDRIQGFVRISAL